jgi:hypothetical protein
MCPCPILATKGRSECAGLGTTTMFLISSTDCCSRQVLPNGQWCRSGNYIRLVTKESATCFCPHEALHDQIPIDTDHSNLVKFPGVDDRNYETVSMKIQDMVKKAPGIMQKRRARGMSFHGRLWLYNANSCEGGQPVVASHDQTAW